MTAEPIRSLDARYYTDPTVFEAECAGLLSSTWQFACHSSQLENPGDYVAFEMAGESLFCVKGRDGQIRTFYNVCQHRAHQLVSGSGSTRVVVCPYHAWTYELTGALRSGPNIKNVPGLDKSKICLTEVRTEIFIGFVFVNLDPDARPMENWFPDAQAALREWVPDWPQLKPLEWVEIPERCNWKVSVENYSECYHCSLNHPTFATGVVKPETYDIQPHGQCLRHTTECQNLESMTYEIDRSRAHALEYSSWFLWPMFSFQVYPGNVLNTYHWRATGPDTVTVWRGWYTVDGWDDEV
ncbi:MAG: aromatic ring-hydroxylating dioxygenase subunit alpha, partial [Pseudomonadota bacterium]